MACELKCVDIFDNTNFLLVVHWNRAFISNGLRDISMEAYMRHGLDLLGSRAPHRARDHLIPQVRFPIGAPL